MATLIPVVELEPATYSKTERPLPPGTIAENPEGWSRYWAESLADSGIVDLEPLTPGSWLVPVSRLFHDHVLQLLIGDAASLEQLGPLCGGYVLSHAGVTLRPGCCGDLANIEDWRKAATYQDGDWEMVWIGHPWTFVRASGDTLSFAEPSEDKEPTRELLSMPRDDLRAAIDRASVELDAFAERLAPVVRDVWPKLDTSVAVSVLVRAHARA